MDAGYHLWARRAGLGLVVAGTYWGVSHFVWLFFQEFGMLPAPVWPAAGIALAAAWLAGCWVAPGLFAGAVLANAVSLNAPWPVAAGIGVMNTLGPLLAVDLIHRCRALSPAWQGTGVPDHPFARLMDLMWFFALGVVLHAALTATGGVAALVLGGADSLSAAPAAWLEWWTAHAAGTVLFAPAVMLLARGRGVDHDGLNARGELIFVIVVAVAAGLFIFGTLGPRTPGGGALPSLLVVPLVWASVRFQPVVPALLLPLMGVIAMAATAMGHGPFHAPLPILSVDILLLSFALAALLPAALMAERRRHEQQLRLAANVFDHAREGILVAEPDGTVVSVNPAFTGITGYPPEEIVGRTPRVLQSRHHDADFYRAMWQTLMEDGVWTGELYNRRRDGSIFVAHESITAVPDAAGRTARYVSVFTDVTELRQQQERVAHLAYHDVLTGLPNRTLVMDRLEHAVARAARNGEGVAVIFLDLDNFKRINDGLGHHVGDDLIKEVADRVSATVRAEDTVARLGGDEFLLFLEGVSDQAAPTEAAERILQAVRAPLMLHGHRLEVTPSLGIALYPDDGEDVATLMQNADTAMYGAKAEGRATYRFFDAGRDRRAQHRMSLESELRRAVDRNELELFYQPKVCLDDGGACGAEGLVRWYHPERGLVSPGDFIPLAEETGLIKPIGDQVLEQACQEAARLPLRAATGETTSIAVNLSAEQLRDPDLARRVDALLSRHTVPRGALEVELTESVVMRDPEAAGRVLHTLREMGVKVAVDDFGTGYSSLAYLRALPLDQLKIDRAFVNDMAAADRGAAIVRTILAMSEALDLTTVAEGIETDDQARLLTEAGCHFGQGFLYARPLRLHNWRAWMARHGAAMEAGHILT